MTDQSNALERLEQHLGRLLVTGVVVSASVLAVGLAITMVRPDATSGAWLLNAGLIILMATPILRVIVSFAEYVRMKDWFFVLTTAIVLAELAFTVVTALRR